MEGYAAFQHNVTQASRSRQYHYVCVGSCKTKRRVDGDIPQVFVYWECPRPKIKYPCYACVCHDHLVLVWGALRVLMMALNFPPSPAQPMRHLSYQIFDVTLKSHYLLNVICGIKQS